MHQIEMYADAFAEKVPANTFSPAQVQNFLQGCRSDPLKALAGIEKWVVENREREGEGKKGSDLEASFVEHELGGECGGSETSSF